MIETKVMKIIDKATACVKETLGDFCLFVAGLPARSQYASRWSSGTGFLGFPVFMQMLKWFPS
jgi:hypothetical protein